MQIMPTITNTPRRWLHRDAQRPTTTAETTAVRHDARREMPCGGCGKALSRRRGHETILCGDCRV